MRELGYVQGQNIVIEPRSAEGKLDRLPGLAAELVQHAGGKYELFPDLAAELVRLGVVTVQITGTPAAAGDARAAAAVVIVGAVS